MAYAAVISLKHTIHRLQNLTNFPRITKAACDKELDSLISVLRGLDDESSRMIDRSVIHESDAKIRDAVWKVEDVLDKSYHHCLNISASQGGLDEKGVEQEINSFLKKVKMFFINPLSLNISPSQGGLDEKGVKQEINSLLKTVKILKKEYRRVLRQKPLPAEEEDEALSLSAAVPPVNNSPSRGLDKKGVKKVMNSFLKKAKMLKKDVKQKMNTFLKKAKILREEYDRALSLSAAEEEEEEALSFSAAVPPVNNSTTVGLKDLSHKIINQLLQWPYRKHAVSVVGMAGIGKTHLAALIYHHPRILQHFPVRVWVRAGPKSRPSDIYVDILSQLLHKPRDLLKEESEDTLKDLIRSLISSRRCLVVLDDLWTTRILNYFTQVRYLSNTRFLITTRLQEVAEHTFNTTTLEEVAEFVLPSDDIHQIPLLNNEESWNLFWQNVSVAENSCPPQLERAGRKIADKCEGLPLLILAVANILRGLEKTEEYWMKVAENKTTTFTDAYENIYEVLLPSYEYLPQHLKPCFLYMGVFPQSFEIRTSRLFNLWAVEDFLDPTLNHVQPSLRFFATKEEKLELFAIKCVDDLVSNSLAIVCEQRFCGFLITVRKTKSSKLHSAFWYVCVKEARKSNFFHVLNKLTDVSKDHIEKQRRLSVQNNILLGLQEVYDTMAAATSTTRSLLCTGEAHQYPVRICFDMMLLMRVLDALAIRFYEFPNEVLKLLQLRYLSLTHNGELPSSINKLRQLQFLILGRHHHIKFLTAPTTYLPDEIWDMEELRHLRIMGSNLPDPSEGKKLSKLLTLYVNANSCSETVFRGIPHLKKLGITIELEPDAAAESVRCLEHIKLLDELESLKCVVVNPRLKSSQLAVAPPNHLSKLPTRLKKLSLNGLGYSWKDMTAIGSLPFLQVLKLRCSAFQGPHWEIGAAEDLQFQPYWETEAAGQFRSLKFLLLEDIDLVHWTAEDNSFHNLRHLSVRHCYKLKKIPLEMGDIRFLKMMEVDDCSPSVVASAHQIKEKTNSFRLQVVINSSWNL